MDDSFSNTSRKRVPGRPFVKGDPRAGRPKGRRDSRTLLAEKLMGDDLEAVTRSVINAARNGDMTAARIIMDRMAPVRKGRAVTFDVPETMDADGVADGFKRLLQAVGAGELTPEEATQVAAILELRRKSIETSELADEIKALREHIEGKDEA
jgi:hypothetical protein